MSLFYPNYKIAAAHNNTAGLVSIELITPSNDRAFVYPSAYGSYRKGVRKVRPAAQVYFSGFASVVWTFSLMTKAQFYYLQTTYCANGYSGEVTVKTRTENPDVYSNYNATIVLPDMPESRKRGRVFIDVPVVFATLVFLS